MWGVGCGIRGLRLRFGVRGTDLRELTERNGTKLKDGTPLEVGIEVRGLGSWFGIGVWGLGFAVGVCGQGSRVWGVDCGAGL